MAAAGGSKGPPTVAERSRSFAEMVSAPPQPIPEVMVPFRNPKMVEGRSAYSSPRKKLKDLRPLSDLPWL
ncbi:hypothetical protein SLA2020_278650 [Shorea laevis]